MSHSHYFKDVSKLERLDIYRLLELYEVTDPGLQHIAKKALCAGKRGAKDFREDLENIRDTAVRRLEMLDEDDKSAEIDRLDRISAQSTTLEDGSLLTASKPEWTGQSWMTSEDASKPVEKPWIDWAGGHLPVGPYALVEVKFRGGSTIRRFANELFWGQHGDPSDIVAYKVVK